MLFGAQSGAKPQFRPLFPGDSITSAYLFQDARRVAFLSAALSLPKNGDGKVCQEILVSDTEITKGLHKAVIPDRGEVNEVWEERWTVTGCGGQVRLLVTFIPDGKGGTSFAIKPPPNPALQSAR